MLTPRLDEADGAGQWTAIATHVAQVFFGDRAGDRFTLRPEKTGNVAAPDDFRLMPPIGKLARLGYAIAIAAQQRAAFADAAVLAAASAVERDKTRRVVPDAQHATPAVRGS